MSQREKTRHAAGIGYVGNVEVITITTIASSTAIPIPDDATHTWCQSHTSAHTVKFGNANVSDPANDFDGFRVNNTNNQPRVLPIDPSWTHFKVRANAANTSNRFSYSFMKLKPGVTII